MKLSVMSAPLQVWWGDAPPASPRVRAWQLLILSCFSHVKICCFLDISFCMFKPVCTFKQVWTCKNSTTV